jgi:hypothetical protein
MTLYYPTLSKSKLVRRTFFSFHYQVDVTRAHVVRNSWVTKEEREDAGFFDASIFESKKRAGDDTLKSFLTEALKGTSVTCVLIGGQTAFRKWVRYELVRSFHRGNGLFGIRIHSIKNLDRPPQPGTYGDNPFDHLAYRVDSNNDRVYWQEKNNGQWEGYNDVPSMALSDVAYDLNGKLHHTFSTQFYVYDWALNDGYNNIKTWIDQAAEQAGK